MQTLANPRIELEHHPPFSPPSGQATGSFNGLHTESKFLAANATGDVSNPGANVSNYASGASWNSQTGNVTTVGSAAANNYFGTADMNGNVREWNDAVIGSSRGLRGGSWGDFFSNALAASFRSGGTPSFGDDGYVGFRVASVPEPSAYLLTVLSASVLLTRRRRSTL